MCLDRINVTVQIFPAWCMKGKAMKIHVLDPETIDKIAAGEVVERPASVVKELVENAIDAGATSITVEIKEGGIGFIRITDNGSGIEADQIRTAFLRHATSKISNAEDLSRIASLGFRGEALSSISAVSRVELITKTREALSGTRVVLEGTQEKVFEEIGAPDGTTFIIRNLFFNVPVRRKFLRQPATEGGYIIDLMEHLALSRPDISFKFIVGSQVKFYTSGNGELKEVIYRIFGRDIAASVIPIDFQEKGLAIKGYLGSPSMVRSNRNFEIYFINGRFIRSQILSRAIEEGYKEYLMQHKFPLCVLHMTVEDKSQVDVNVHPTKMEVRFSDGPAVYQLITKAISERLRSREMIPETSLPYERKPTLSETRKGVENPAESGQRQPSETVVGKQQGAGNPAELKSRQGAGEESGAQPGDGQAFSSGTGAAIRQPDQAAFGQSYQQNFCSGTRNTDRQASADQENAFSVQTRNLSRTSAHRKEEYHSAVSTGYKPNGGFTAGVLPGQKPPQGNGLDAIEKVAESLKQARKEAIPEPFEVKRAEGYRVMEEMKYEAERSHMQDTYVQETLFDTKIISQENRTRYRIVGQVFDTYWLVQFEDKLLIIDQHAAHEKVKYERLMKHFQEKAVESQNLLPPVVVSLTGQEAAVWKEYRETFAAMGFEVEEFGGNEYTLRSVPMDLFGCNEKQMFLEVLDELSLMGFKGSPSVVEEKIASMSCKAAVKGNQSLSAAEAEKLIDELLTLDNPYNCPHGRPTIISMSKYEMEKRFKR